MTRKIFLGADHRGFAKKQMLLDFIRTDLTDFEPVDLGAHQLDPADDYNDFAIAVAKNVVADPNSLGILLCNSVHGVSIQANRKKGARAIVGLTPELARLGREHNDANIICFSAQLQSDEDIKAILPIFLTTAFLAEDRLIRRNHRLDEEI